jgi:hypothetical protein
MPTKGRFAVPYALAFLCVSVNLGGCERGRGASTGTGNDLIPSTDPSSSDMSLCEVMKGDPLNFSGLAKAVAVAESDLPTRQPRMRFVFLKAIASPEAGKVLLVFANSTITEQYFIYVVERSSGAIERGFSLSGFYYREAECPDAQAPK